MLRRAAALSSLHLGQPGDGNAGGLGDLLLAGGPFFQGLAEALGESIRQGHRVHAKIRGHDPGNPPHRRAWQGGDGDFGVRSGA